MFEETKSEQNLECPSCCIYEAWKPILYHVPKGIHWRTEDPSFRKVDYSGVLKREKSDRTIHGYACGSN